MLAAFVRLPAGLINCMPCVPPREESELPAQELRASPSKAGSDSMGWGRGTWLPCQGKEAVGLGSFHVN